MAFQWLGLLLLLVAQATSGVAPESPDRRQAVLENVQATAERLSRFEDSALAVEYLTELASRTCAYDVPSAQGTFQAAADRLLRGIEPDRRRFVHPGTELIGSAFKCSPTTGAAVQRSLRNHPVGIVEEARRSVFADPGRAAALLTTVFEHPIVSADAVKLLAQVRMRSPAAADAAFLKALTVASGSDAADAQLWSVLGSYAFPVNARAPFPTFSATRAASSYFYSSGQTPVAPELVLPYLTSVARAVLETDNADATWRTLASDLAGKAEKHAPDLFTEIENWELANLPAPPGEHPDKVPYSPADVVRAIRFHSAWSARDYTVLEALAAEFGDEDLERRARHLIQFARASDALAVRQPELALGLASHLRAGLCRALIYHGAAHLVATMGDAESAFDLLLLAAEDARKTRTEHRAKLLLHIAQSLAPIAPDFALTTLQEALRSINRLERPASALEHVRYAGELTTGSLPMHVGLRVPTLPGLKWPGVLVRFARGSSPDRVEPLLLELHDEKLLGEALVTFAGLRLRTLNPGSQRSLVPSGRTSVDQSP